MDSPTDGRICHNVLQRQIPLRMLDSRIIQSNDSDQVLSRLKSILAYRVVHDSVSQLTACCLLRMNELLHKQIEFARQFLAPRVNRSHSPKRTRWPAKALLHILELASRSGGASQPGSATGSCFSTLSSPKDQLQHNITYAQELGRIYARRRRNADAGLTESPESTFRIWGCGALIEASFPLAASRRLRVAVGSGSTDRAWSEFVLKIVPQRAGAAPIFRSRIGQICWVVVSQGFHNVWKPTIAAVESLFDRADCQHASPQTSSWATDRTGW